MYTCLFVFCALIILISFTCRVIILVMKLPFVSDINEATTIGLFFPLMETNPNIMAFVLFSHYGKGILNVPYFFLHFLMPGTTSCLSYFSVCVGTTMMLAQI